MVKVTRLGSIKVLIFIQLCLVSTVQATEGPVIPVPYPTSQGSDKDELGEKLFNDPVFSRDHSQSCNSCHSLQKAGTDRLPHYIGINKLPGTLNTPTVLNSKLNFRQFWDGRAKTFADVIDDHIQDKTVFANSWEKIIEDLKKEKTHVDSFKKLYPTGEINIANVKDALTTFLNNLLTPDSPFDKFLGGDQTAISDDAKKGYELFQQYGCITCHEGPNFGGNLVQKLGIYQDYYAGKTPLPSDLGLYNVTKKENDRYVFKVPSLRNIELTGPYLHDGSVATLEEMVQLMGVYQVGQPIPKFQVDNIVKFLKTLNGTQENQ